MLHVSKGLRSMAELSVAEYALLLSLDVPFLYVEGQKFQL